MAINLQFDLLGNPEPPSIVLANRNGNKLGQLNVNIEDIDVADKFSAASEFSFTLNKYIDGELTPLWDKVVDFKLVYCPEWDLWFEAKVELDEATETVKTVYCTQLGQAELSQIMIYNTEINTEADIEREDYKISILYDEKNPKASILHRLLEKAPHYSIVHVDESIQRIQRQFSFDDTSICDAFNEIAEEIGCLFVYHSNSQAGGKPNRSISVYDLQQNCNGCGYRGEFTDKCPKCGSTDIKYGYGDDTTIFVTADELATQGISFTTDIDSVKNCFKLEAGDDLMTATIRNCNPNGSDYIWYFSDSMKEDMSDELVERLESYDKKYQEYYKNHISTLNNNLVAQYNALVEKYDDYYNTKSTCLSCDTEGYFYEQCSNPNCNSKNILVGSRLQTVDNSIKGYPDLMTAYYNTIDLLLYLESGLMPNVEMSDTTAEEQLRLLTTSALSPVAVNVKDINNASLATADSAVLSMAKVLVRPTYKVAIKEDSSSLSAISSDGKYKTWTGKFVVTNYSDETDTASHSDDEAAISVRINNDAETFLKQKIEKTLNKENTDDYSITGLFAKDYDAFCEELHKYALNPLDSFSKACDTCISILTEQGASNKAEKPDLYDALYKPYFDKQQAIHAETENRQNEIAIIEGVWDNSDETNPQCTTKGLQQYIEECQQEIQAELDFEKYLGEDLWLEFCAYRREDKYSNSNYISDGLNNAELFAKANEFIGVAEEEIFKSAELQHSISATLNNLLSLPKFKPLLDSFKTGNWIRVQVDDKVYKLRLLEYDFGYGNSESINVEFSDVTKIKNGMTDVQDVFEQASSMASSYDSVQRQAKKGNVARNTIDQWIVDGLNAANVQIASNDSEEIILTKNGLLARSYDDITGTYSAEQLKITHNIMAYTDDNWETVKQAIGKHKYNLYNKDENKFVDEIGYGMNADFVVAGVVSGSQMIGGDIYSDNYSVTDATGSYLNLRDGTFSFGGGSLRFDGKDLLISSPNVLTKNEVTTINEEYLKTTSVYAENLKINAAEIQNQLIASQINTTGLIAENISATTIEGKTILGGSLLIGDKTTDTYAEINTSGKLTCTGADITGAITATSGIFDNCTINENCTIKGTLDGVDGTFAGTVESATIKGSTIEGGSLLIGNEDEGYGAWISDDDYIFHAYGAIIEGDSQITGKITATSLTLTNGLKVGDDEDGFHTWIGTDGVLNANGAKITGEIHAYAGGTIAGWYINDDSITSTNGTAILYSGSDESYRRTSLADNSTSSPVRFCSGYNQTVTKTVTVTEYVAGSGGTFTYSPMNCKEIIEVVSCKVVNGNGSVNSAFEGNTLTVTYAGSPEATIETVYTYVVTDPINYATFTVLEDGSLYASAVNITGTGNIGGNILDDNGLHIINGEIKLGDNFSVSQDGTLHAYNADITGIITAEQGGDIGGWEISNNCLIGQSKYSIQSGDGYATWIQDVELSPTGLRVWRGSTTSGSNKGNPNYQVSVPWLYLIWRFDQVIGQINKIANGEKPTSLENLYDWEDIDEN